MDFDPAALAGLRDAFMEGLTASPRMGHRATAAEKQRVYAQYVAARERHYGAPPARERLGGPVNSLAGESPVVRRVFGGP